MEKRLAEEVKLFEEMVKFMEKIYITNEQVTIDDRKILSVARDNVNGVHRELCDVISSSAAIDVSLSVRDYRSKVEKELNDICNKVSNLTIKADIKDYVDSVQHDCNYRNDVDADSGENNVYKEENKKLTLESEDYKETLMFMDELMVIAKKEQVCKEELNVLSRAYIKIRNVYLDLCFIIDSDASWDNKDATLRIKESRSKIENELSYICNNVSNLTIKEAYSQHLVGFKAGHRPKRLPYQALADRKRVSSQSEIRKTEKKSKLCSGERKFLRGFDPFADWDLECTGKGNEIQHASTTDASAEDDSFAHLDPRRVLITVPDDYTVYDSSEDDYDSCTEMSDGIYSF